MRRISALLTFLIAAVHAQTIGQNTTSPNTGATFQANAQLVVETVSVKDKNGNPIEGLTKENFTITEDGALQTIKFFEFEKLPEVPITTPLAEPSPDNIAAYKKLPHAQITPETPGNIRYRDRRLIALYFDLSGMPVSDQLRAFSAGQKFIKTQMTPADLVSIMMFSNGAVQVLADFTDDRDKLLSTMLTMIVGEDQDAAADANDTADNGAAFGQDAAEFNLFNTDRQLSALQTASKMLGTLNEKKMLIYFASGLTLNGIDNQAQLHATINAAIRAGVSLWAVDARGLVAQAPLGDATRGSAGGLVLYNGAAATAGMASFQRSQDTLYTLASDTGGKALLDYNDLSQGIVQAQKSVTSYYIIGYYTSNETLNGKLRRVKITLNDQTAKLDYRQGYYAGKVFAKFSAADKDRQLEDALMLGDPITELTIAMELDYFQLNRAEYFVPLIVKIPGNELALARKGGAERTVIDFIGEVRDEFNSLQTNLRDKVDVKISESTAAELAKRPIEYDTGFTLLPGKYKIKFLARDAETGRIGTYETGFVIPNLNKEEKRIPISSVVLSSQRVDLKDALYNAVKDKNKAEISNPLVQDGQKLIPSVTRVFSKSRDMYVFLQAYEPAAQTVQPLIAFVTFYQGQRKAFETPPLPVTEGLNNRLKTVPLKFSIALTKLPPGEYNCQVTVLDPTSQKASFWQAPVMLVP
jgi:VWFA-related protein